MLAECHRVVVWIVMAWMIKVQVILVDVVCTIRNMWLIRSCYCVLAIGVAISVVPIYPLLLEIGK